MRKCHEPVRLECADTDRQQNFWSLRFVKCLYSSHDGSVHAPNFLFLRNFAFISCLMAGSFSGIYFSASYGPMKRCVPHCFGFCSSPVN